jgi:hypothetical protein
MRRLLGTTDRPIRPFERGGGRAHWLPALTIGKFAPPYKQRLGDLGDEPQLVEHVGVGESNTVSDQMGAACQLHPLVDRRAKQSRRS